MHGRLSTSLILTSLSAFLLAAAPTPPPSTAPAKLPFTLGKDTTIITQPLLPDGTPDYVAALNDKFGKGVTPDNNALIPLLQIRGAEELLPPEELPPDVGAKLIARFLELAGAKAPLPDAPAFQTYYEYIKQNNIPIQIEAANTQLNRASQPWMEKDMPALATYLKSQDRFFDIAAQASGCPRFYTPFVSSNGHINGVFTFHFINFSNFSRAWVARAMLRTSSHDVDGAIHDLVAIKRIARLLTSDGSALNVLTGNVFERNANEAAAAIPASGELTEAQCDALAKGFDLPPLSVVAIDEPMYHWRMLETFMIIAGHDHVALPAATDPQSLTMIASIDTTSVDWNLAMRDFNEQRDHDIALLSTASFDDLNKLSADLKAKEDQAQTVLRQNDYRIEKGASESTADYTRRVVGSFVSGGGLSFYVAYEKQHRHNNMICNMVQAIVAAAKFKAHTGQWPKTLDAIVPAYLKQLPMDLYAASPAAPMHYEVTNGRARIFSAGPDHIAGTADDISIPEPPAPSNLP